MQTLADWAIFIAGAVILLAHVINRYHSGDKLSSVANDPVLGRVHMRALTSSTEYFRGGFFYSAIFLGVYAIAAWVPDVGSQLVEGLSTSDASGPQNANAVLWDNTPLETGEGRIFDPIALSAAIIVGVSLPMVQTAEGLVRSIAYWIAGIPRGVHRTLRALRRVNYCQFSEERELSYLSAFARHVDGRDWGPLTKETVDEIKNHLRIIDVLRPPVVGDQAATLFRTEPVAEIDAITNDVRDALSAIRASLAEPPETVDVLNGLHGQTRDAAARMQSLFALNYVRSPATSTSDGATPANKIIKYLREQQVSQSMQDLTLAVLVALVLMGTIVTFAVWIQNSGSDPQTLLRRMQIYPRQEMVAISGLGIGAILAMYFRNVRVDQGSWPKWEHNQPPILTFLGVGLLSGLLATFFLAAASTLNERLTQLMFQDSIGNLVDMRTFVADLIRIKYWEWFCAFIAITIFSMGIVTIADLHKRAHMTWWKTVSVAVALCLPPALCYWLMQFTDPLRLVPADAQVDRIEFLRLAWLEVYPFLGTMCLILILYSVFAEIAEPRKPAPRPGKTVGSEQPA